MVNQVIHGLTAVHMSLASEHPMHFLPFAHLVVVHYPCPTSSVVILVKLLCLVGARLRAIEVPSEVSTAQLLLFILAMAPAWIGASAIRVFLNGQPLEWQDVGLANGDFVAVHSC